MYHGESVNYRHLKKEMLFWTKTPEEVIATIKQIFNKAGINISSQLIAHSSKPIHRFD